MVFGHETSSAQRKKKTKLGDEEEGIRAGTKVGSIFKFCLAIVKGGLDIIAGVIRARRCQSAV